MFLSFILVTYVSFRSTSCQVSSLRDLLARICYTWVSLSSVLFFLLFHIFIPLILLLTFLPADLDNFAHWNDFQCTDLNSIITPWTVSCPCLLWWTIFDWYVFWENGNHAPQNKELCFASPSSIVHEVGKHENSFTVRAMTCTYTGTSETLYLHRNALFSFCFVFTTSLFWNKLLLCG